MQLTEEQVQELEAREWDAVPQGAYVNLFSEDFANDYTWEQICDQLKVPHNTDSITILYFAKKKDTREII